MRSPRYSTEGSWIVSPCVMGVLVYGVMLRIVALWWSITYRFGDHEAWFGRGFPLGLSFFSILALVDAALLLLLAFELSSARRAAPSIRRGHIAGVLLGMLTICMIHYAGTLVYRVVERDRFVALPPTAAELQSEPIVISGSARGRHDQHVYRFEVSAAGEARVWRNRDETPARFEVSQEALARFRELLILEGYCELDGDHRFIDDTMPLDAMRWITVRVGPHLRHTCLVGREFSRLPATVDRVEPTSESLRTMHHVWDEVAGWFDDPAAQLPREWVDPFRELLGRG